MKIVSACILFLLSAFVACAMIDATLQMQLGNPSGATFDTNNHTNFLIQRTVESLGYNDTLGEPNWASWDLTSNDCNSVVTRQNSFAPDTNGLPATFHIVGANDYSHSGYDRGHLCDAEDRSDTTNDNNLTFLMDNMMPQAPDNNEVTWSAFESYCRDQTTNNRNYELLIICGPCGFNGTKINTNGYVSVPQYTWKIAVILPPGTTPATNRITTTNRVIAIKVPNTNGISSAWQPFITSAAQIEVDTGLTFFTALPPAVAAVLRAKVDGSTSPPPVILTFSPTNGAAGTYVVVTGTNFNSATEVTFNGLAAGFTVNSSNQITAVVPTNAGSGFVSVTVPSGTAVSSNSFTVLGGTVTNLPPVILTFSPTIGAVGANVVITGTNFNSVSAVTFNGTAAGFTVNSSNQITAVVPATAGSGFISVTTPSGTVVSSTSFTVSGGASYTGVLAGWDTSAQSSFGPSPFTATTNAANLGVGGLTRASGVKTSGSGAAGGWGGTGFTSTTAAAATNASQFVTCSLAASNGYSVSYNSISRFDYYHSGSGATNAVWQFQVGTGPFTDITNFNYPVVSAGGSFGPIDLSSFPALQNVPGTTNVIFRLVNYGATGSSGTWYIYNTLGTTAPDLAFSGTITQVLLTSAPGFQAFNVTGNNASLTVTGSVAASYTIAASTNLLATSWMTLLTTNPGSLPFTFVDTNRMTQRFYRVQNP